MSRTGREIRLVSRPVGMPRPGDFRVASSIVAQPKPGEVLVRNRCFSLDTYMRGRMGRGWVHVPPFDLDVALDGKAAGEVIESSADTVPVGVIVVHDLGWREYAVVRADAVQRVDTSVAPASSYLGLLGVPGLVGYSAVITVGELRDGDVVFISSAAGAVGIVAGQIAKMRGHRVVASTSTAEKARYLQDTLGFDEVFNYKDGDVRTLLTAAAPDGIDLYLDCVGGDHLEAAIDCLRSGGRIAKVGGVAEYNAAAAVSGPRNLMTLVIKGLTLRGLGGAAMAANNDAYLREAPRWRAEGRLKDVETVVDGLERAPQAFIDLLAGKNLGKMIVTTP